jgi:DNA-binding NtrC family response regulator
MRMTVLTVSEHSATLITRNLILERAGYEVISTMDLREAVRLFEKSEVHAVVLGESISPENRQHLGETFKRLKPPVPIVMLCKMSDSRALRAIADEQVESHEDPQFLLEALARATKNGHDGASNS